jgi:hypothetical protein
MSEAVAVAFNLEVVHGDVVSPRCAAQATIARDTYLASSMDPPFHLLSAVSLVVSCRPAPSFGRIYLRV